MKIKLAPALLLAALALGGCAPGTLGVDIGRDLAEQTIPGDPAAHTAAVAASQAGGGLQTMTFTSESDPVDGSIASVFLLRSVTLAITPSAEPAGDTDCWDFVSSVTVSIESMRAGTTLQRTPIATGSSPGCTRTLDLAPIAGINLKPFTDEGFRIVTEAVGVPPEDDVAFAAHLELRAAVQ